MVHGGEISRRTFLKYSVALGVLAPSLIRRQSGQPPNSINGKDNGVVGDGIWFGRVTEDFAIDDNDLAGNTAGGIYTANSDTLG
jgi:hypothetical protein